MVTAEQILEATGLRSAKTLTRWAERGIIPRPDVRTHPSGRGKLGYWPDWVLDRCVQVTQLRAEGHSLVSAAQQLELERVSRIVEEVRSSRPLGEELEKIRVCVDGDEYPLSDLIRAAIIGEVATIIGEGDKLRAKALEGVGERTVLNRSMGLLEAGYNPVLLLTSASVEVVADFLVSLRLSDPATHAPTIMVPLIRPIRDAFSAVGVDPSQMPDPVVTAARKVLCREGDALVEYQYFPGGRIGFELIRESAATVGQIRSP